MPLLRHHQLPAVGRPLSWGSRLGCSPGSQICSVARSGDSWGMGTNTRNAACPFGAPPSRSAGCTPGVDLSVVLGSGSCGRPGYSRPEGDRETQLATVIGDPINFQIEIITKQNELKWNFLTHAVRTQESWSEKESNQKLPDHPQLLLRAGDGAALIGPTPITPTTDPTACNSCNFAIPAAPGIAKKKQDMTAPFLTAAAFAWLTVRVVSFFGCLTCGVFSLAQGCVSSVLN